MSQMNREYKPIHLRAEYLQKRKDIEVLKNDQAKREASIKTLKDELYTLSIKDHECDLAL